MSEVLQAAAPDGLEAVLAIYRGRPEMLVELMVRHVLRA